MTDTNLPSQPASELPQARAHGNALAVVFGLIAILAIAAAIYFWRKQDAATVQRDAAQAQASVAQRNFRDANASIETAVSGVAESLAGTPGLKAENAQAVLVKIEAAVDKLATQTGNDPDVRRSEGVMYIRFVDTYLRLGDPTLAVDSARKGTKIFRSLAEQKPNDNDLQSDIGLSLDKVGEALLASGDGKGSLAAFRDSLQISRDISAKDPGNNQWRTDIVLGLWRLASAGDQPRDHLTEALKILQNLKLAAALSPDQEKWTTAIEHDLSNLN
jgi:hypothetical protein